jgi:hypothetical protein
LDVIDCQINIRKLWQEKNRNRGMKPKNSMKLTIKVAILIFEKYSIMLPSLILWFLGLTVDERLYPLKPKNPI